MDKNQMKIGGSLFPNLKEYVNLAEVITYKKHDKVFYDSLPEGLGLVLSGELQLLHPRENEEDLFFHMIKPMQAILTLKPKNRNEDNYFVYFKCMENVKIAFFSKDVLFDLMSSNRNVLDEVINYYTCIMYANHYRIYSSSFNLSQSRILNAVAILMADVNPDEEGIYRKVCNINQKTFAQALNIHFTTFNKILNQFRDQHILDIYRGEIVVYDMDKLKEILESADVIEY